ncbi:LacI family DNA-binding transcriptional regulator [Pseudomarimonas salicorniae]|uniref:LacI family DNA-binding transcriptional regulator n=1 Tax=Pseudomarimonas salicorniae TaxID=2933270 RepID=A0ABT0GIE3_9GAMM|nr:LacI family DNA-binding transcriptional regulator [Lysobacter sp. CAU 1642]MCK7594318.1 LacI family DNA-binding transcriptional regulator [Lysobacter sp. CAU 1642]
MAARARIEDVATAAGVSIKTVSRVLNREPNVRPQTRERVMQAAQALRYTPHVSARSLAGNRSFNIALLYNNPSDNYMMGVISGVLSACAHEHYHMILCPAPLQEDEVLECVDELMARSRPDGLLLTPPLTDSPVLLNRLDELEVPFAMISPKLRDQHVGVAMDEPLAAEQMVEHLAGLGHKRIAHILGHPAHGASGWRLAGYRRGMARAGLAQDPALEVPGEFSFESGVAAAKVLLDREDRPTAIFAANDDMAAGVIHVAYERGLRVPQDLSVCGFDDTPMSRQLFPALTTIHQPTDEMGRMATLALLGYMRDQTCTGIRCVPHTLIVRRSTGPAP